MKTVENQKVITIGVQEVQKGVKNRPYTCRFIDTTNAAMRDFNTLGEVKLYLYLCQNNNGYKLAFSPSDVAEEMGLAQNTVRNAFKALMDKGYIWLVAGNKYQFQDVSIYAGERYYPKKGDPETLIAFTFDEILENVGDRSAAIQYWNKGKEVK